MSDLHAQIMNIQTPPMPALPLVGGTPARREELAYKIGHRDARHAAAELATGNQFTPVAIITRNAAGQIAMFALNGEPFDMSAFIGKILSIES